METKVTFAVLQASLLVCALFLMLSVPSVSASSTVYIRPDGSVDPSTAPIERVGDLYVLTGDVDNAIYVERSNVVVDGSGHTVQYGLRIEGVNNVTIQRMQISGEVFVLHSSYDRIIGNNVTPSSHNGIWLLNSNGSDISENNISHSLYGIEIAGFNNTIRGNNVTDNEVGVYFEAGTNNVLRTNKIARNEDNLAVYSSPSSFVNDVDSSNTVDGKPVYWWINKQDLAVPTDAGFVALVNCTRITVKNLNLTNNFDSLDLVSTTNSTIIQNNVTDNGFALVLLQSSNNSISDNKITKSYDAITLDSSNHNQISRNTIVNNAGAAVHLLDSSNNTISNNNITGNVQGVGLEWGSHYNRIIENNVARSRFRALSIQVECSGNEVLHNNFMIDSSYDIYINSPEFNVQIWDDGYPSGGNYWSIYDGLDFYTGTYQNLSGSDGIGDTALILGGKNADRYPLMNPWGPSIPGDVNKDGKVDVRDLSLVGKAFGSYASQSSWNPIGDINQDGKIDIKDLVLIAKNFGRTQP